MQNSVRDLRKLHELVPWNDELISIVSQKPYSKASSVDQFLRIFDSDDQEYIAKSLDKTVYKNGIILLWQNFMTEDYGRSTKIGKFLTPSTIERANCYDLMIVKCRNLAGKLLEWRILMHSRNDELSPSTRSNQSSVDNSPRPSPNSNPTLPISLSNLRYIDRKTSEKNNKRQDMEEEDLSVASGQDYSPAFHRVALPGQRPTFQPPRILLDLGPVTAENRAMFSSLCRYHMHVKTRTIFGYRYSLSRPVPNGGIAKYQIRLELAGYNFRSDIPNSQYRIYFMNTSAKFGVSWLYTVSSLRSAQIFLDGRKFNVEDDLSNRHGYCDYLDVTSLFDQLTEMDSRMMTLSIFLQHPISPNGALFLVGAQKSDPNSVVGLAYRRTLRYAITEESYKKNVHQSMELLALKNILEDSVRELPLIRKFFRSISADAVREAGPFTETLFIPFGKGSKDDELENDDIVVSEEVISLRCPYSLKRLIHPGKSLICQHSDCFDVQLLLHLAPYETEQRCPICKKNFDISLLYIDPHTIQLLLRAPKATSVLVKLDGTIEPLEEEDDSILSSDDSDKIESQESKNEISGFSNASKEASGSRKKRKSDNDEEFDPSSIRPVHVIRID